MKKTIPFSVILCAVASLMVISCKKSSTGVAFTNPDVKPLFDSYCASCHASGTKNSGNWLYDPSDYDGSIKGEISDLYKEVYTRRSMPVGRTLSSDQLNKFKAWYDQGYPAN